MTEPCPLQVTTYNPGWGNSQKSKREPLAYEARTNFSYEESQRFMEAAKQSVNPRAGAGPGAAANACEAASAQSAQSCNAGWQPGMTHDVRR